MERHWYASRQTYGPRPWVTALLILLSGGSAMAFAWVAPPDMPLWAFIAICLALGVVPVQAQWTLWRKRHPIVATEPEVDPDLSYIECLRLHYNAVAELNRVVERTDRLSLVIVGSIAVGAFVCGVLTSFLATLAVVVAFMSGVHVAVVMVHRRIRRHAFAQLKDGYQEIELQNMVEEGE